MGRLAQVLAGILLLCGLGCKGSPLRDGLPAEFDCLSCHGGTDNSAPPRAVNGATSTTEIAVGAHQRHVNEGPIAARISCDECHVTPIVMNGDDHPDPLSRGTVMAFGPLAQSGGAAPAWDRTSATCTNTYCHGATLAGTSAPAAPRWTKVDGSQMKCNSCHANSPGGLAGSHQPHAAYTCDTCHANVASADLTILDPYLHVDGQVDVSMAAGTWDPVVKSCSDTTVACHGSGSLSW